MPLLERDGLLAQLDARWSQAREGPGQLVFIEGEAGIGKTTVLRAFAASVRADSPVYWGACEAMATPRPLGALDDIAIDSGGKLAVSHDGSGERHRLFVAFLDLLAERPSLAVLEDVHWADEATLDLLRYAGRRIARTRSLLVASFRNDEVVPAHPLRAVLGDLATAGAPRLAPQPLSLAAVRSLSDGTGVDATALHEQTAGNPFFVTEVLAATAKAVKGVPATVQDAVLARAGRLSPSARAVLDAAAVAGPRAEAWLLRELTAAESGSIDECLATGVLRTEGASFVFRHELARQAVLQAMAPTRAIGLHRLVLQALLRSDVGSDATRDPARLVVHAEAAGDVAALRHWAPVAAREAAVRGAHRQAAEHWARALAHCEPSAERAALLDASAEDVHMSVGLDESIAVRSEAARLWCAHGRPDNAAVSLARQSLIFLYAARNPDAAAALREARSLVADQDETRAARVVRSCAASLCQYERESDQAIALASSVFDRAGREGDKAEMAMCLKTIGRSQVDLGRVDEGLATLERGLALALGANENRLASQIFASLGSGCVEAFRLAEAETWLRKGIDFCTERDLHATQLYQTAWLARALLEQSRWEEAAAAAHAVIAERKATVIARIVALVALGRLRARRGDPGVWSALDEARDLAAGAGPDRFHVARVEAAWLEGRDHDAACEAAAHLPLAIAARRIDVAAQLALWCRLGGNPAIPIPDFCSEHPFALEAAGRWQEAAHAWRSFGCPFETARALSQGDEPAQRQALAMFEVIGARPMVERVRQRLRAAGVRGLPRGTRRSTRQHPASLTDKELAVLELLTAGLRNKEIAVRLHRSARTVEHHLAAIFVKLGVATRAEAVSAAYRLGVAAGDSASAGP
ncbi:Transcriptional regulatory protein ComA [Burkholderiaceae bacterium]|nr:Transcriptional regulatory protein ComA [Burkholderiaceae bacterium]